jgi:hypothetical protein
MKYYCKCLLKTFEASCKFIEVIPTYDQIYPDIKVQDDVLQYCCNGAKYCPYQKVLKLRERKNNANKNK